jgi:acyl carrier protein
MDRASLRQALIELIHLETGRTFDHLDEGQNLKEHLGLDSVDLVSLVLQVENRFNLRVESEELAAIQTAGDLLDLLGRKLGPQAAAA